MFSDKTYTFEKLPPGYTLWGKQRPNGRWDTYLYGHPSGSCYRSASQFVTHFVTLMESSWICSPRYKACSCELCIKLRGHQGKTSATANKPPTLEGPASDTNKGGNVLGVSKPAVASDMEPTSTLSSNPRDNEACTYTSGVSTSSSSHDYQSHNFLPQVLPKSLNMLGRQENNLNAFDEEGNPDVIGVMVGLSTLTGTYDRIKEIREPESVEWCIENDDESLIKSIEAEQAQPRWMPRVGEIVLYVPSLTPNQYVLRDQEDHCLKIWDKNYGWLGNPKWEAGHVLRLPEKKYKVEDLVSVSRSSEHGDWGLSEFFQVMPVPRIGHSDQPSNKIQMFPYLNAIRPFLHWQEYLRSPFGNKRGSVNLSHTLNIKDAYAIHPTIKNAFDTMSSVSVVYKHSFRGEHTSATIWCKGIRINSELTLIGDTVRLTPAGHDVRSRSVTDTNQVMTITQIKLKLVNIDSSEPAFGPEHADQAPPPFYSCLHVAGIVYTTSKSRAYGSSESSVDEKDLPAELKLCGPFYHDHDPKKRKEVPFHRIGGRIHGHNAYKEWFTPYKTSRDKVPNLFRVSEEEIFKMDKTPREEAILNIGQQGMIDARIHAIGADKRINRQEGKTWFFADRLVEQFDLQEVMNQPVGPNACFGFDDDNNEPRSIEHVESMRNARTRRGGVVPGHRHVLGTERYVQEDDGGDDDEDEDEEEVDEIEGVEVGDIPAF